MSPTPRPRHRPWNHSSSQRGPTRRHPPPPVSPAPPPVLPPPPASPVSPPPVPCSKAYRDPSSERPHQIRDLFIRRRCRRTGVLGIFPDHASLIRLVSMLAIEANDCHDGEA